MSKIVLTLQEAVQLWPALEELVEGVIELVFDDDGEPLPSKRLPAKEMPAKASYRLGKICRTLGPDIEVYEKTRAELIKRLGTFDEDKNSWTVKEENMAVFTTEMEALQKENITLDGVMEIDFDDISHLDFKPASILALEPLIDGLD